MEEAGSSKIFLELFTGTDGLSEGYIQEDYTSLAHLDNLSTCLQLYLGAESRGSMGFDNSRLHLLKNSWKEH